MIKIILYHEGQCEDLRDVSSAHLVGKMRGNRVWIMKSRWTRNHEEITMYEWNKLVIHVLNRKAM